MRLLLVDSCYVCGYAKTDDNGIWWCIHRCFNNKRIYHLMDVPDWCPLPKYEDVEKLLKLFDFIKDKIDEINRWS